MTPLLQATRTVPIVFAAVADPVGAGYVDSLARPGGNATGFISFEYGLSGKWLELLKQIAPSVTRAAVQICDEALFAVCNSGTMLDVMGLAWSGLDAGAPHTDIGPGGGHGGKAPAGPSPGRSHSMPLIRGGQRIGRSSADARPQWSAKWDERKPRFIVADI